MPDQSVASPRRCRAALPVALVVALLWALSVATRAADVFPPSVQRDAAPVPAPETDGGGMAAVTLASLSLSYDPVYVGVPFDVIISLTGPAPAGGQKVDLTFPADYLFTPAAPQSVTVPEGATQARVTVMAELPIGSPSGLTICASAGGVSLCRTVAASSPASAVGFRIEPSQIQSGKVAWGTITLGQTLPDPIRLRGSLVGTWSGKLPVSFPDEVTIEAGQTTKTFPIITDPMSYSESFTITYGGGVAETSTVNLTGVGLRILASPGRSEAGKPFADQPIVIFAGADGQLVRGLNEMVGLSLTGPGGHLLGTTSVRAVDGVARFTGLSVDAAGTGYQLQASTPWSVRPSYAVSPPFDVVAPDGPAAVASVTVRGPTVYYGVPFTVDVQMTKPTAEALNVPLFWDLGDTSASQAMPQSVIVPAGAQSVSFKTSTVGWFLASTGKLCAGPVCVTFPMQDLPTFSTFTINPNVLQGPGAVAQVSVGMNVPLPPDSSVSVNLAVTDILGASTPNIVGLPASVSLTPQNPTENFIVQALDATEWAHYVAVARDARASVAGHFERDIYVAPLPLKFKSQPLAGMPGQSFPTQPIVIGPGTDGQPNSRFNGLVGISLDPATGTPGAKLTGTTFVNAVNGTATFTDLAIDKPGTGYVLVAEYNSKASAGLSTAPGLPVTSVRSAPFDVALPAVASLVFTPQNGYASQVYTGAVMLSAPAPAGQAVVVPLSVQSFTSRSGSLTIPPSVTVPAGSKTASFTFAPPGPYHGTGTICAGTGASAVCSSFTTKDLPYPSQMDISPSSYRGGNPVPVTIRLSEAVPSGTSVPVSLTVRNTTGVQGTFSTLPMAITFQPGEKDKTVSVPTISPVTWETATLMAYATAMQDHDAHADVSIAPRSLAIQTQPGHATSGAPFGTQPVVIAPGADGKPNPAFNGNVVVYLDSTTGTAGATLTGTKMVTAVNGVAHFADLAIDKPGTGYVLVADYPAPPFSGVSTSVRSAPFDVAAPGVASLTLSPATKYLTIPFTGTVTLTAPAPASGPVTVQLSVGSYSGDRGGTLTIPPTVTVPAGAQAATFSVLATGLTSGSGSVCATLGASQICQTFTAQGMPRPLTFRLNPGYNGVRGGDTTGLLIQLTGAVPPGGTVQVPLSYTIMPYDGGAYNGVKVPIPSFPSVVTFQPGETQKTVPLLTPRVPEWRRYLIQLSERLPDGQTQFVDDLDLYVAPPVMVFTTQPGSVKAGGTFLTQPVLISPDANGQPNPDFNGYVRLAITSDPSGYVAWRSMVQAVNGVVRPTGLSMPSLGDGYVLVAEYDAFYGSGAALEGDNSVKTRAWSAPFSVVTTQQVSIPHTSQVMGMDGNITPGEWNGATTISLGDARQDLNPGFWSSTYDYSASAQFKWDEQALYVAATVADDTLQPHSSDTAGPEPNHDGLSVYLGLGNPLDPIRTTYAPSDFHILAQPWGSEPDGGALLLTKMPKLDSRFVSISLTLRWKRVSFGYTMEARIPWDALSPSTLPVAGQTIGFNVVGHDYDNRAPLVDSDFSFTRLPASDTNPQAWATAVLLPPPLVPGDADGDGVLTLHDAALAASQAAGLMAVGDVTKLDVAPRTAPGVYGDGKVDLQDIVRILRHISGLEYEWPG